MTYRRRAAASVCAVTSTVALSSLFETGQTLHQDEGGAGDVSPVEGGEAAQVYEGADWNQLVPVFFLGAGSDDITAAANSVDPVRGNYIDNVDIANLTLNNWWSN